MTTMTFAEAQKLFEQGKYQEALEAYEELAKIYGLPVVEYNIQICKNQLNTLPTSSRFISKKTHNSQSQNPNNKQGLSQKNDSTHSYKWISIMEKNANLEAENKFLLQHIDVLQAVIEQQLINNKANSDWNL